MARKKNYLNNRDLLKEIHKSKLSYCSYLNKDTDTDYDYILETKEEIFGSQNVQIGKDEDGEPIMGDVLVIRLAKEAKAKRLGKIAYDTAIAAGEKVKQAEFAIDPDSYADTDLVFRVTEWGHIPIAPPKIPKAKPKSKRKKKIVTSPMIIELNESVEEEEPPKKIKYVKIKFPPFFHYRLDEEGHSMIVAKSHWQGDLDTGEFDTERGAMTDTLARMFMKLCERYATKANWRGYCVDEATEALTKRGWLDGNDITEDDEILSFNGNNMVWSSIKSIFRDDFDGLMHKLDVKGMDALITPEHKLVTERGLVKAEYLLESDKVILMGDRLEESGNKEYSDAFVELIGWIVTEGNYQPNKGLVTIYQNGGPYADRIRSCLNALGYKFSESNTKCISFRINKKDSQSIMAQFPDKDISMVFIVAITADQREMLLSTMIDGELKHNKTSSSYTQKKKSSIDLFQALCSIAGHKANIHYVTDHMSYGKPVDFYNVHLFAKKRTNVACIDFHGGKRNGKDSIGKGKGAHPNEPTTYYKGQVWCPETEYGSFVARRNGKAYLTGNTYNDEMRGQALLQLADVGLRFNEARSDNPFAYYTAVVNNAFTRILNLEKQNQKIRDDILESNDLTPSYTRQNENDIERMKKLEALHYDVSPGSIMKDADWWNNRKKPVTK